MASIMARSINFFLPKEGNLNGSIFSKSEGSLELKRFVDKHYVSRNPLIVSISFLWPVSLRVFNEIRLRAVSPSAL